MLFARGLSRRKGRSEWSKPGHAADGLKKEMLGEWLFKMLMAILRRKYLPPVEYVVREMRRRG
jgi:hypothetical protein